MKQDLCSHFFGDTIASEHLVQILNDDALDNRQTKILITLWHNIIFGLKTINTIKPWSKIISDNKCKEVFAVRDKLFVLWLHDRNKEIDQKPWPSNVKSHFKSCFRSKHRAAIRNEL